MSSVLILIINVDCRHSMCRVRATQGACGISWRRRSSPSTTSRRNASRRSTCGASRRGARATTTPRASRAVNGCASSRPPPPASASASPLSPPPAPPPPPARTLRSARATARARRPRRLLCPRPRVPLTRHPEAWMARALARLVWALDSEWAADRCERRSARQRSCLSRDAGRSRGVRTRRQLPLWPVPQPQTSCRHSLYRFSHSVSRLHALNVLHL